MPDMTHTNTHTSKYEDNELQTLGHEPTTKGTFMYVVQYSCKETQVYSVSGEYTASTHCISHSCNAVPWSCHYCRLVLFNNQLVSLLTAYMYTRSIKQGVSYSSTYYTIVGVQVAISCKYSIASVVTFLTIRIYMQTVYIIRLVITCILQLIED